MQHNEGPPSAAMPRIIVRMPADVKAWIRAEAKHNASSQNSEIVRAVRERMERAQGQREDAS